MGIECVSRCRVLGIEWGAGDAGAIANLAPLQPAVPGGPRTGVVSAEVGAPGGWLSEGQRSFLLICRAAKRQRPVQRAFVMRFRSRCFVNILNIAKRIPLILQTFAIESSRVVNRSAVVLGVLCTIQTRVHRQLVCQRIYLD